MDTLDFSGTRISVTDKRYSNPKISKKGFAGFRAGEIEKSVRDNYEMYETKEALKKLLQPLNVFKTISRNDFEKWDIDFLVEYMQTHHGFTRKNAVAIYKQAQKVFYRHCENHPELLTLTEVIFLFLHDLFNQMEKEELFFSYIRQIAVKKRHQQIFINCGSRSLDDIIQSFENGHKKALNYLKVIRQITGSYKIPADACNSYKSVFEKLKEFEEDLILHFRLEKDIFFPKAIALAEKI